MNGKPIAFKDIRKGQIVEQVVTQGEIVRTARGRVTEVEKIGCTLAHTWFLSRSELTVLPSTTEWFLIEEAPFALLIEKVAKAQFEASDYGYLWENATELTRGRFLRETAAGLAVILEEYDLVPKEKKE